MRLANAVQAKLDRPLTWVHVPVPRDRSDEAYFAALAELSPDVQEVYLGLVHAGDEEGTRARIEVARCVLGDRAFGVATECGMGRTPVEDFASIMEIMKGVSGEVV